MKFLATMPHLYLCILHTPVHMSLNCRWFCSHTIIQQQLYTAVWRRTSRYAHSLLLNFHPSEKMTHNTLYICVPCALQGKRIKSSIYNQSRENNKWTPTCGIVTFTSGACHLTYITRFIHAAYVCIAPSVCCLLFIFMLSRSRTHVFDSHVALAEFRVATKSRATWGSKTSVRDLNKKGGKRTDRWSYI